MSARRSVTGILTGSQPVMDCSRWTCSGQNQASSLRALFVVVRGEPEMPLNRRKFLKRSAVTGAGVALAGAAAPAAEAAGAGRGRKPVKRYALTVMGTTDLHGHVFNWDYYKDAEYTDDAGNAQGLARMSTLVDQVRREKGRRNTLLLDAGDSIQEIG